MLERKYKLVFLPLAEQDLMDIVLYISHELQNPTSAVHVMNRIRDAIFSRSKAPESFQKFISAKKRSDIYHRINIGRSYSVFYFFPSGSLAPMVMIAEFHKSMQDLSD